MFVCSYGLEKIVQKCIPSKYDELKEYCKNNLVLNMKKKNKNVNKYIDDLRKKHKEERSLDEIFFSNEEKILTTFGMAAAYRAGENEYIKTIIENVFLKYFGIGIANYINIINPEKIILGGGMIEGFLCDNPKAENILNEYVNNNSLSQPRERVTISSEEKGDISSIGAALIFKDESYPNKEGR